MMTTTRRDFLRAGSGGGVAAIFAPFLQSVAAHAAGDVAALPKRFVFVVKASGIDPHHLVPGGLDVQAMETYPERREKGLGVSWEGRELPEVLRPFDGMRERLTVVQGVSGNNFKGNHTSGYGALSCYSSERVPLAPTVDAMLGLKHSTGPYPMFGMATNGALLGQASVPDDAYVFPNISALKGGQGVAFQASPTKAFDELFGAAVMDPSRQRTEMALNRNLMDFLKDDAKRISRPLGADDRQRFEGYVGTFDSLRRRAERKAELGDRVKASAPEYAVDRYTATEHMPRMEAQFEMAAAVLVAGLTNVVTLRPDTLGTLYGGLGFGNLGLHAIGHGANVVGGMNSEEMRKKVDAYHMGLVAKMASTFAAVPEGDGSMLDRTLIVYTSCNGGRHHGGMSDWPFVMVGGTGGSLKTGQYLQLPSYGEAGHRTIGNLYLSLLGAGGVDAGETFGQLDPGLKGLDLRGPIAELMA